MSMTREEAIKTIEFAKTYISKDGMIRQAIDFALSALRPVSREQVKKLFPGCPKCRTCDSCAFRYIEPGEEPCLSCNGDTYSNYKAEPSRIFCSTCGSPLTDEAVGITLKRLEALKDAKR